MGLIIKNYPLGPLQENTYLVIDESTGYKAVIDPGYFGEYVSKDIGNEDSLKYIILTHGHNDHFNDIKEYKDKYINTKFVAPEKEKYLMNKGGCIDADVYVSDGDNIVLGDSVFNFIETPGHTEGSVCILSDNILFSGDTLFRFSVGNTSFETGNWNELQYSIKNKLYVLDDEIIVYPGHGPYTTIGDEKRGNPFV